MSEEKTTYGKTVAELLESIAYGANYLYSKGFDDGKRFENEAFWNAYQDNGNRRNYAYAFAGPTWKNLKPKYYIRIGTEYDSANNTFYSFDFVAGGSNESEWIDLEDFAEVDFSQATAVISTFCQACFNTVKVDFNNVLQGSGCFNYARIKNLYIRLSGKCTIAYQMFSNMNVTENIIFTDDSVLNYDFDFRASPLTRESLISIIRALKDLTGTGTAHTLYLGATNLEKLTDSEKAVATEKGWTLN